MESPDGLKGLVYDPRATHNMFHHLRLSVKCLERRRQPSYLEFHWKDNEEKGSSIGTWNIRIPHASGWIHELIHGLRYCHRDTIGLSDGLASLKYELRLDTRSGSQEKNKRISCMGWHERNPECLRQVAIARRKETLTWWSLDAVSKDAQGNQEKNYEKPNGSRYRSGPMLLRRLNNQVTA